MHKVVVAVGSNVGNRLKFLTRAREELRFFLTNLKSSNVYETKALLPENAPEVWNQDYLNAVITGFTDLSPEALLLELKNIEKKCGRVSHQTWSPRTLDCDLIDYDHIELNSPLLCLPHPRAAERDFVVEPLRELDPEHFLCKKKFSLKPSMYQWHHPLLLGILNVTPDSFSDGGTAFSKDSIQDKIRNFINHGANFIDIGVESSRPQATLLSEKEELNRIELVLKSIPPLPPWMMISVDTRRPQSLKMFYQTYPHQVWLNSITGVDDSICPIVAEYSIPCFYMHSLSIPPKKDESLPEDPLEFLKNFSKKKKNQFKNYGINVKKMIFDPGIGFGLSAAQCFYILNHIHEFEEPILIGHSRKSFLSLVTKRPFHDRDIETLAWSIKIAPYTHSLRVHNVEIHSRAFEVLACL